MELSVSVVGIVDSWLVVCGSPNPVESNTCCQCRSLQFVVTNWNYFNIVTSISQIRFRFIYKWSGFSESLSFRSPISSSVHKYPFLSLFRNTFKSPSFPHGYFPSLVTWLSSQFTARLTFLSKFIDIFWNLLRESICATMKDKIIRREEPLLSVQMPRAVKLTKSKLWSSSCDNRRLFRFSRSRVLVSHIQTEWSCRPVDSVLSLELSGSFICGAAYWSITQSGERT